MPRQPNPDLEKEILDAAQKLWKRGGEKALTMRAVARASGSNTPSVYRRFRDRDDILRALLQRIRLDIAAQLEGAGSPEEGCECYLDYALAHAHEYELYYRHAYELNHGPRARRAGAQLMERPARNAMKRKLQEKFGPAHGDHERLVNALWMLAHGTAMLLIAKSILPPNAYPRRSGATRCVRVH